LVGHLRLPRDLGSRLIDALVDPARRERTMLAALAGYIALWSVYGVLAQGSRDLHIDMTGQFALAQNLAWGFPTHPPLAVLIVRLWFALFPTTDWAFYVLAMINVGVTLWIVWRLSARFLDGEKRVVGLALLMFVPFFNFHALKYNANTVLLPVWALTTLWFLQSYETHRPLPAALAGLAAAASMYGKYWSIVLVLGLGIAALIDQRRATYFRSAAPWITIAVGSLALAPHAAWLITHDFVPFSYATSVHGSSSVAHTVLAAFRYLLVSVAYISAPLLIVAALRPSAASLADMALPSTPQRRLAAAAFWAVLLLPLLGPIAQTRVQALWSMAAVTLLPVMLLSSPLLILSRSAADRVLRGAIIFPFTMAAIAPIVGLVIHRIGPPAGGAHSSLLAEPVERLWRKTTAGPLRLFASVGTFTDSVAFYLPDHPLAAHALDDHPLPVHLLDEKGPALDQRIARDGIVLLCPEDTRSVPEAVGCADAAERLAARFGGGKRAQVVVARQYLGVAGAPGSYLIIAVAPGPGR
jgi:4-amino-4-deoxy-L-arabinose transferase-like glycosyltransferase